MPKSCAAPSPSWSAATSTRPTAPSTSPGPKANEENSGFLPIERAWVDRFIAAGYVDTFRHIHGDEPHQYSWWSYKQRARVNNVGWRIDYFFVSEELAPAIRDAWIENNVYGSDHCPVGLELAIA